MKEGLPANPRQMAHTMLDFPVPLAPIIIFKWGPGHTSQISYVRKFSIAMRTIEPSTKGPDDGTGGAELFLLLGTSDEGSLGAALLEARGVGVEVFLLGVAILASP